MICDKCNLDKSPLKTAIINGKFGSYCLACIEGVQRIANVGAAAYSRARDHDAHEADLLQPWDAKGTPNTEFIRNYPDEAKEMFSDEELAQYG